MLSRRWCPVAVMAAMVSSTAFGYSYTSLGKAGGWDNINGSSTVTTVLDLSDYTLDTTFSQVDTALRSAYTTWDNVSAATNLNFQFKADLGGNYDRYDGPNGSVDTAADYRYANITMGGWLPNSYFTGVFGSSGSNVLAVTWTAKVGAGKNAAWVVDIYFNDAWNWSTNGSGIDIETVMLHELGHALGFDHEDKVPSVMASYYNGIQRSLYPDDIAGLTALYGSTSSGGGGKGKPNRLFADGFYFSDGAYLAGVTLIPEPMSLLLVVAACSIAALRPRRAR